MTGPWEVTFDLENDCLVSFVARVAGHFFQNIPNIPDELSVTILRATGSCAAHLQADLKAGVPESSLPFLPSDYYPRTTTVPGGNVDFHWACLDLSKGELRVGVGFRFTKILPAEYPAVQTILINVANAIRARAPAGSSMATSLPPATSAPPPARLDPCPTPGSYSRPIDEAQAAFDRGSEAINRSDLAVITSCMAKAASLGNIGATFVLAQFFAGFGQYDGAVQWLNIATQMMQARLPYAQRSGSLQELEKTQLLGKRVFEMYEKIAPNLTPELRQKGKLEADKWVAANPKALTGQNY